MTCHCFAAGIVHIIMEVKHIKILTPSTIGIELSRPSTHDAQHEMRNRK